MTNALVWLSLWLYMAISGNCQWICECGTDVVGNKYCNCELHCDKNKSSVKP